MKHRLLVLVLDLVLAGCSASTASGTASSTGATTSSSGGQSAGASSNASGSGSSGGGATTTSGAIAFFVSPSGSDDGPGTLAQPFATLARAQSAMRASATVKTTYLRAGTYTAPPDAGMCPPWAASGGSLLALTPDDDGETWSAYDGDGSAILDGLSTLGNSGGDGGNGAGCGFYALDATDLTIDGLQFQNFLYSGFWGWNVGGASFVNNEVHDTTAALFGVGAVDLISSPSSTIANNDLHDLAYRGISIEDVSADGGHIGDTTIAGNVILNSCTWPATDGGPGNDQNGGDCGAIYLNSDDVASVSTNIAVTDNFVRDVNASSNRVGDFGGAAAVGVYLDLGVDNTLISGNVVTGIVSSCFLVHGGSANRIESNLCDLGNSNTTSIVFYAYLALDGGYGTMTGNAFQHNVVVAALDGGGAGFRGFGEPPNPLTIADNDYFNYSGGPLNVGGDGGAGNDTNPVRLNPGLSCWTPRLSTTSPVLGAPVDFPGLPSGWGPDGGLSIPQTGTPPSWPTGC